VQTLRLLADRGLITGEELGDFAKLVRLRNLVVHGYWVVDDKRICDSVRRNFRRIVDFTERISDALQT